MLLTVSNWDISQSVLWELSEPDQTSLMGSVLRLPPLDQVAGDILSWKFAENDSGCISPIRDEAWNNAVNNYSRYRDIAFCAHDEEDNSDDEKIADTTLAALNRFIEIFIGQGKQMEFDAFELFLAMCRIPEPHPKEKRLVTKGYWTTGNESSSDVRRYREVLDSFDLNRGADFFKVFEQNRESIDLHCNYTIHGFSDLALVSVYLTLKSGRFFVRCAHCGRLFAPSRSGEIYCNRIAPNEKKKSCKEAAKYAKQLVRERSNEAYKIYKSINTIKSRKAGSAPQEEKAALMAELYRFRDEADGWKEGIRNGTKDVADYIEWLKSHYKKRGKN